MIIFCLISYLRIRKIEREKCVFLMRNDKLVQQFKVRVIIFINY